MGYRTGIVTFGVLALAALAAGGLGYNIGLSHGLAAAAPGAGAPMAPFFWYHPWGFGFGFGPLPFLLLMFVVLRGLVWRGLYNRRGCGVPQRFDEWHRRAHEQMNGPQPQAPPHS